MNARLDGTADDLIGPSIHASSSESSFSSSHVPDVSWSLIYLADILPFKQQLTE